MTKLKETKQESFDVDQCIIITELTPDTFPFEIFKFSLKYRDDFYTSVTAPDKVRGGDYRSNIFYHKLLDIRVIERVYYIERNGKFFKISGTTQGCGRVDWETHHTVYAYFVDFLNVANTYRHKDLYELRELTIAKMELKEL